MDKIAKQLMLIARDYKFAETKEEIKNILGSVQIRIADGQGTNVTDSIDEAAKKVEKAKTPQQAEEWFKKMQEELQKAEDIQEGIADIRDDMAKQVSNWNTALKQIFKIFKKEEGFPRIIEALNKNKYFKGIGDQLKKSFEEVGKKCEQYNFKKMDEKKFIELANDDNSKLYENFIQPFVNMYNGYMDKFEVLQETYQKVLSKYLAKMEKYEKMQAKDEDGWSPESDDKTPQWDFSTKQKFSKKLFKIASELENILR